MVSLIVCHFKYVTVNKQIFYVTLHEKNESKSFMVFHLTSFLPLIGSHSQMFFFYALPVLIRNVQLPT